MRFHILGLPHTKTNTDYTACAYTMKAFKFAKMMTARGHEVIHYGTEGSKTAATEDVTVLSEKVYNEVYGEHDFRSKFFKFDVNDLAYQTFYKNAIAEIQKRKKNNDFILPFWGAGVKPICDAHPDLITVEPGIGYASGSWAKYRVYESHAIMAGHGGSAAIGNCQQSWYNVVIGNYFDPTEFTYKQEKGDYFLFLGRVYSGKGIEIAIQVTKATGQKLIVAGQGTLKEAGYAKTPDHVTEVGYADLETRKELMANAKGSFIASMYAEPFGGVQIENLLSGTPIITTDWGVFPETNIHGMTGYRCHSFNEFCWAVENIDKIDPATCRSYAMNNYSLEPIATKYEAFFDNVLDVHVGNGWYERKPITGIALSDKWIPVSAEIDYDNIDAEERPFAKRLAKYIKDNIATDTVYDIGCGPGTYVEEMNAIDLPAVGYDIDTRIEDKDNLFVKDIVNDTFLFQSDCVICLEVLEHIDPMYAEQTIKNLAELIAPGGTLIFTAAKPGQGGTGHINCQPKEYWADLLKQTGLTRSIVAENHLIQYALKGSYMGWFVNNLIILKRKDK